MTKQNNDLGSSTSFTPHNTHQPVVVVPTVRGRLHFWQRIARMSLAPCVFALLAGITVTGRAQSNATTAGLTGGGAAAALGAGLNSGAGSTSSASAGGGGSGGSNAPIEVNIMVYHGMAKIAKSIAELSAKALCKDGKCDKSERTPILLEDTSSANQIGLYRALTAYTDQLTAMHNDLEPSFSLHVAPSTLTLPSDKTPLPITLTNTGHQPIQVLPSLFGTDSNRFTIKATTCAAAIAPNGYCQITVTCCSAPQLGAGASLTASLNVAIVDAQQNVKVPLAQSVALTAQPPSDLAHNRPRNAAGGPQGGPGVVGPAAAAGAGPSAPPPPQWVTNFGAIGTALEGLKSNMSYSSSSTQPTTQSFQVLLESELTAQGLYPYTSTSSLDPKDAVADLTQRFAEMLALGSDINIWSAQCKAMPDPSATPSKPMAYPDCANSNTAAKLSAAQQMLSGYTSLLQSTNDGAGNMVLLDILRGAELSKLMGNNIPSLQVSIAAAAGSTRVNAFFLVNLFYLPKPSYNAGVITTFELRDSNNKLLQAGSRAAFYDYNNTWKGSKFNTNDIKNADGCDEGSFCAVDKPARRTTSRPNVAQ